MRRLFLAILLLAIGAGVLFALGPRPDREARLLAPGDRPSASVPVPDMPRVTVVPKDEAPPDRPHLPLRYEAETEPDTADTPAAPAPDPDPVTYARVVVTSAGVVEAEATSIRLAGIEALEIDAQCRDADDRQWPCGRLARTALSRLIRARSIVCTTEERLDEKTISARCQVGPVDVNEWLVRHGWARPAEGHADYASASDAARSSGSGQWRRQSKRRQ